MTIITRLAAAAAVAVLAPAAAMASTCPSYETPGMELSYTAESAYAPQSTQVVAGGDLDLSACMDVPGEGFIVESPDFSISYDAMDMGRALEIRVSAECDAVLLVNTASGEWLFNDDANESTDPMLHIEGAESGRYDVWVGTYEADTCSAELTVETF